MRYLQLESIEESNLLQPVGVEHEPYFYVWIGDPSERRVLQATHEFCHWRIVGTTCEELLNVDLDLNTSRIFTIEVILYKRRLSVISPRKFLGLSTERGLPRFHLEALRAHFRSRDPRQPKLFDVTEEFELGLMDRDLSIELVRTQPKRELQVGNRLSFIFDSEGHLCGFRVRELNDAHVRALRRFEITERGSPGSTGSTPETVN